MQAQTAKVTTAIRTTAGTKYAGDDVGQALDRGPAALRLAHHSHDLREQRFCAHPLRRASESCRCR